MWQVEGSFRIPGQDLRVRPIWHGTADRIQARIAISFMAFACLRRLAYRVANRQRRMSPVVVRSALTLRRCSILRCKRTGNRCAVPSKPTPDAQRIYATTALLLPTTPYAFT